MKIQSLLITTLIVLILSSCGEKPPKFTQIIVKNDSIGVLLDTKKRSDLKILEKIFHEKIKEPNAGPEFRYLVDITKSGKTVRWQYSEDGYIRNYEETNSMIFLLKDVALFNRTTHITIN